jgi:hypothetical protein
MPYSSSRQLACHRNALPRCKKAYLRLLATLNVSSEPSESSDSSDVDDMDDILPHQEAGGSPSHADMDYEQGPDEPAPVTPPPTAESLPPSISAPEGEADKANENDEEVHQTSSASPRIEITDNYYAGAGSIIDVGTPRFKRVYEQQQKSAPDNIHYPFASDEEWEYGNWMNASGLPLTEMDKLLNLAYVRGFLRKSPRSNRLHPLYLDQKAAIFISNR